MQFSVGRISPEGKGLKKIGVFFVVQTMFLAGREEFPEMTAGE